MMLSLNKKIKRTPTILQMEAVECGAASLAMILAYYGRWVSLEELRAACGVTRDGSKASNVMKAALQYDLDTEGFKVEPEDLDDITLPAIIFWNFNHFLVLEGYHDGKYYLNDPANGPRVVNYEEFNQSFTGVTLTFQPSQDFKKGGEKSSLLRFISSVLKGSHASILFFILTGLFLVIPGIILPVFTKIFIDDILIKNTATWVVPLLFGMVGTAFVRMGLLWLQNHYLLRFEEKLALSLSSRLFWHILKLPVGFFSQRFGGEIGSRVAITNQVAQFLSRNFASTVLNFILVLFFAVLMFFYDWILTSITIFFAIANIIALYILSNKISVQKMVLLQAKSKVIGTLMSNLQIVESLKASGNEDDFFTKYTAYHTKSSNSEQKLLFITILLSVIPEFIMLMNTSAILIIGSFRVMDGILTMGMLVAFQSLMASFMAPINNLVQTGGKLQEMTGNLSRIEDIQRHPQDKSFDKQPLSNIADTKLRGKIEIKNISYGYSKTDPPFITDFNLTLNPGERVALVGSSGSGKSTVAKILSGIYDPWEGEILFDNINRNSLPRPLLTNSMAIVDQQISMFEGTIRENITLWDQTIPDPDMVQAATDAAIHQVVLQKPKAYDYTIEESGKNFSGGEKQRLEIARALVNCPSILILDEATSALDPATEKEIDANLRRRGCSCLIIAHRLSTIRDCEEIIVMDKGQIVERGNHEQLVANDGYYAKLIQE